MYTCHVAIVQPSPEILQIMIGLPSHISCFRIITFLMSENIHYPCQKYLLIKKKFCDVSDKEFCVCMYVRVCV